MGPYAPIRTLDADVIFDIIDSRPEMNSAIVGRASIRLRDLQEQKRLEKVPRLSIILLYCPVHTCITYLLLNFL